MKKLVLFLLCASCGTRASLAAGSGDAATCSVDVSGIAVTSDDPYAYPPYAIDGCRLAYLGSDKSLHLKDFAAGTDIVVDTDAPRRPSLAGDTLTWESTVAGQSRVRVRAGASTVTIDGIGGEPRAAHDAVAFTRWLTSDPNGDTDVMLFVPSTGAVSLVAGGVGQQRFADVSDTTVAVTDFFEDKDHIFTGSETNVADIDLFDRATGVLTSRKKPGKQAFPILAGDGLLVYHDWASIHPQPKLEAYDLFRTTVASAVESDTLLTSVQSFPPYTRPSGRGGVVEWVVRDGVGPSLWRATSSGVAKVDLSANDLYAPATADGRTLIGAVDATGAFSLKLLNR